MTLLYLSSSSIPSKYANSVHVMKMCSGFSRIVDSVILLAKRNKADLVNNEFLFYDIEREFQINYGPWLNLRGGNLLFSLWSLWRVFRLRPTIVIGRDLVASTLASIFQWPVILELHSPPQNLPAIERILLTIAVKKNKLLGIVVISSPLKLSLVRMYGTTIQNRILVQPDAADVPSNKTSPPLPGTRNFHIGYIGQLSKGRGIGLIKSLALEISWAEFHIVGGSDTDLSYWTERCRDIETIHFHGFLPHNRAATLATKFDLLVAPYQNNVSLYGEGDTSKWMSPLKIFEYMAAHRPILCSDIDVLHEVLEHNFSCLFCKPEDVDEWIRAIKTIYNNREYGERLAENAYQNFLMHYTWQARASNIVRYFNVSH